MSEVVFTEKFFAEIAGWEAMKQARAVLQMGKALSSNWTPPILKGVVQEGSSSYRAGLVIKNKVDIENMCTCRASREWGTICSHSVAVGLHYLQSLQPTVPASKQAGLATPPPEMKPTASASRPGKVLLRGNGNGEPCELFVILPPNLEPALARGKLMVCFEGKWRAGRMPLNALPKNQPFDFSAEDAALLEVAESLADGETPAMIMLDAKDFAKLLPALKAHPGVTLGKSTPVTVSGEPTPLAVKAMLEANGEIVVSLKDKPASACLVNNEWAYAKNEFRPLGLSQGFENLLASPVRVPRSQVPMFLSQQWPKLASSGKVDANFKLEDFSFEPQAPKFHLELKGGLAQLSALLQCAYGARIMTVGVTSKDESLWLPDPQLMTRYSTRDYGSEQAALGRLLRAGFTGPDSQGRYQLLGQNQILNYFARLHPKLEKEWTVTLEERLERSTAANIERVEPKFEVTSSGVQWFDLGVVFASQSGEKFSNSEIQRLILSGQSHTRLKNGKYAVIDTSAVEELQEVLLDCSPEQHANGYRLSSTQAGFLESTLQQHGWQAKAPTQWRERALQQSGEAKLECPPLGDLEDVLRPYQKTGVAWLHFLRANRFGGILADEMGLGKTLQTLAFLRNVQGKANGSERKPSLIICPTSLVFNWVAEAKKFTPTLKVLALNGPQRHGLFPQIPEHDLIVTSYALIRRDLEQHRATEFDTVVLDEAQHIKNRQTQNAQAVKAIRSQHRLVLTGTPLENSVLDLWSIFDFLMPGYLGSAQDFKERYEGPIVRGKDQAAQGRLARRLRPFILRRLKTEVAKDLPDRLEQVSFCELTSDQKAVYERVIEASRKEVLEAVGAQGVAKSRMVILTALLRLRQVCCDLRLLNLENTDPNNSSGKLDLFSELLEEVVDGGHRVLVFSQFVSMLQLIKQKLEAEQIEYCYLDGSTTNRGEVVERFQKTSTIPVFLISLKAGGVGLNLTGADTVIHFDPWWNPAVEDQATSRAHRIGQTRVVTSYKLITRDTVEEKILSLQARKKEIIQATLSGEEDLASALTWEEIQDLLS
jgi:superfamily II DNA or RNA helicase